ncbi:hypothetical protein [Hydrogenophaga sp.]|uniref:hypothetical protein n=1 Tax=Hydrogenophaga sp. TaxID=1904254 RepID=UPI0025BF1240|nr:hypothetical protein [Hydrogenophaga sp.]MBT9463075.1 hypothetical protein [Hydrogenophaga sp.]
MASRRSLMLGGALVLTLVATWYAASVDEAADEMLAAPQRAAPSGRTAAPGGAAAPNTALDVAVGREPAERDANEPQRMARDGGNLFAAQSWKPPPPPPAVAAPAPPPRAPELPYRYLGRMEEDGRVIAFLAEGAQQQPRVVRQGDLLSNYRVDEITPLGMRLTYLPLNETQRLLFGSNP